MSSSNITISTDDKEDTVVSSGTPLTKTVSLTKSKTFKSEIFSYTFHWPSYRSGEWYFRQVADIQRLIEKDYDHLDNLGGLLGSWRVRRVPLKADRAYVYWNRELDKLEEKVVENWLLQLDALVQSVGQAPTISR